MRHLHPLDERSEHVADFFGWFEEILSDWTPTGDEGVADLAELFSVSLDFNIGCALKDIFLVFELLD